MVLRDDARVLMAQLNKKYGPGSMVLASQIPTVPRFPTGSISLDVMLGGGWPGNQWSELIGTESSGKTTIAHKTVAACQARDPEHTTLWVAAEGYDHQWARQLGVDTDRVLVLATNAMEDAYTAMIKAADSHAVDAIVLDSYPALVADEEAGKAMDEYSIGAGAKLTGKFFRKAYQATSRSMVQDERPLLGLIINQWRDKIGGWAPAGQVAKTSPGGHAKDYAYYTRVEASRTEWIDEKRPPKGVARVGQTIKFRTIKNKAAPPQQVATVRFFFADAPVLGFSAGEYDTAADLYAMAVLHDVIDVKSSWLSYGDDRWQGSIKAIEAIREEVDLQDAIRAAVIAATYGT